MTTAFSQDTSSVGDVGETSADGGRPTGAPHPGGVLPVIARLVGRDRRVLLVADEAEPLAALLRGQGCAVAMLDVANQDASGADDEEPAEVVAVVDRLTRVDDPRALLAALRAGLAPEGWLVAAVPNITHGAVRLALLAGRPPQSVPGIIDPRDRRFFTAETLVQLLEAAGFVLGQLERHDVEIAVEAPELDRLGLPPEVGQAITRDPAARTAHVVVAAYPLPRPELHFIQQRMRELALALEAAQRAAVAATAGAGPSDDSAVLRQTIREQAAHLDALTTRLEAASRRESALRGRLIDAHDQLLRRDDDLKLRWLAPRPAGAPRPTSLYERARDTYARLQWLPGIRLPLRVYRRVIGIIRGPRAGR